MSRHQFRSLIKWVYVFIVWSCTNRFLNHQNKTIKTIKPISQLPPPGSWERHSTLASCCRTGVSRSGASTLTMRGSICVRPASTPPPPSWSGSPSPRPGPTSWAARRRSSGQSPPLHSSDWNRAIKAKLIMFLSAQGRDQCAAGVCDQGCDPASLLHLLVSFMRTFVPNSGE